MQPLLLRLIPSVAVATLVVLAAGAHTSPPRGLAPSIEVTAARFSRASALPPCTVTATDWQGDVVFLDPSSELTVSQPVQVTVVADFSFELPASTDAVTFTSGHFGEPPNSSGLGVDFALDSRGGSATGTAQIECSVSPDRPIVTGSLSGVADPFVGPGGGCIELHLSNLSGGPTGIVLANLAPNAPHAFAQAPGQPAATELAHAIRLRQCSPDQPFGALSALQQVVHGLQPVALPGVTELAQIFTVPVTCTALWFEVPSVPSQNPGLSVSVTAELHAATLTATLLPDQAFAVTVTSGDVRGKGSLSAVAQWLPALPMLPAVLEPGKNYVFVLRFPADQFMPAVDFSGRDVLPGALRMRTDSNSPWVELPGADLGLRLIGVAGVIPDPSCDLMVYGQATRNATIRVGGGTTSTALLQPLSSGGAGFSPFTTGFVALTSAEHTSPTADLYLGRGPAAPDEIAISLARSAGPASETALPPGWSRISFARPIVTQAVTVTPTFPDEGDDFSLLVGQRTVSGTAFPPGVTITAFYSPDAVAGPTFTPHLLTNTQAGWVAAPGANPQLGLLLCGTTDPASNALRVLQQVPHAHARRAASGTAILQRFTVPVDGFVRWVELARPPGPTGTALPDVEVGIRLLATSGALPSWPVPVTVTSEVLDAVTLPSDDEPVWSSTKSFAFPPLLHAGQSYLLSISSTAPEMLASYVSNSPPDPGWALHEYTVADGVVPATGTVCFRLIGIPANSPVDVAPPTGLRAGGLQLEVYPNPSGAELSLRWGGGHGLAQLEIIDVRGRVVRRITAGDARAGSITWDGRDSAGHMAPPGVYFATARDGSASAPSRRLIRIR
jgi:hypothetical protein